ncbi:TonB-dependent receptor [Sphingobium sp.]|uniref:TonB-dependent receptor n=1 Tax=Sphingobium sp. TaxID=1912891 RepID=UPI0028BE374E|nr:TonB-dependent receptor [Sphingobium sp.]
MKRAFSICCASSAALSVAMPALAQSVPPTTQASQDQGIGDIIVTAQKRSERLNDVPLSITAASGEQLKSAGVVAPEDLVKVVPGFSYTRTLWGAPSFIIRGVGVTDSSLGITPAVSVYVDQVPLPYLVEASGAAFDLERVEVLKGPQGTLFGQNSTGGAVNFIAAKPTNDFQAGGSFTYGRFNQADIEAFVSGPITSTLRGRLAVRHESRDGWQVSQTRPDDRLGVRDFTQARALLDWDASDTLKFELNVNGWRDRSETQAQQFQELSPQSPAAVGGATEFVTAAAAIYTQPAARNPRLADWGVQLQPGLPAVYLGAVPSSDLHKDNSFVQVSLKGEVQLADAISLTSISAYSHYKQDSPLDTDATQFWGINFRITGDIENMFQELRLAGDMDKFKWMVGGNYSHDSVDETERYDLAGSNSTLIGVRFTAGQQDMSQRVNTVSAFGDVQYEILPDLTAQGSARYTKYEDNFHGCLRDPGNGLWAAAIQALANNVLGANPPVALQAGQCITLVPSPPTFAVPATIRKSLKQNNISWRAGLSWKVSPDNMVYANVTRGYKSGGFPGVVAIVSDQFNPIGQESVLAYEAGFKIALADRMIQLNGAGFYYDYKNKQLVGIVPNAAIGPTLALVSIPKSRISGFELDATVRPTRELRLSAAATYVNSKVVSSFLLPNPRGAQVDVRGEQLPTTPKWQLQGGVDYTVPMSSAIDFRLGASARYQTSSNATFGNDPDYVIHSYTVVDAFAEIESSTGKWSAQVWGRNLFNKYYLTAILRGGDTISRSTGMGATYGITLSYKY